MALIVGIITGVLFIMVLIVGTWRFRKPLFEGVIYECGPNSNPRSALWLKKHIEKANMSVEAVTGNLNPCVFSGLVELIESRLRDCKDLKIRILVGPEVLTLENENRLLELSEKLEQAYIDRYKIRFLPQRPERHFRVVDYTHVYSEQPHPPGTYKRMAESWENSVFKAWEYHTRFEELWKERDEGIKPRSIPLETISEQTEGGDFCQS